MSRQSPGIVAYQRANSCRTEERVREAMRAIESEASADPGGAPLKISRKELCQKAGIGPSTLKNRTHVALLAEVVAWLDGMQRRCVPSEPDGAKKLNDNGRPLSREQEFKALAINYAAAMISNGELRQQVSLLEAKVARLRPA